jgi:hypothetical protein
MTSIEHWGTFEVANFGDLLYPALLEHGLGGAVPDATISLVGPLGGTASMGLDRPVRRAVRRDEPGFWSQAAGTDAIVVGGGDLVHAGTTLAQTEGRLERIDNWGFAVEAGLLGEVRPVAWNALGVPFDIPDTLVPGIRSACAGVQLLTVRDESSLRRLEAAGVERDITVVPDTAVLIDEVLTAAARSSALDALRASGQLPPAGPTLVVHVSFVLPSVLAEVAGALREVLARHTDLQPVLLPIGPAHGDAATLASLATQLDVRSWVVQDPTVLDVAAVLGAGDVVVSTSYHAALVASVYQVPSVAFFHYRHHPAKLTDLAAQLGRERWLLDRPSAIPAAIDAIRAGEGAPDAARVGSLQADVRAHFTRLAEVVTCGAPAGVDLAERDAAHRHGLAQVEDLRVQESRLSAELTITREHLQAAIGRTRELEVGYWRERDRASRSEPELAARSGGPGGGGILDLSVIDGAVLDETPYRWGHVGPLFSPADATRLCQTVPVEHAEVRADSDGRRSWSFRVRGLVAMGGSSAVRPAELDPAWRALADDLGGLAYRRSLSSLTGVDLTDLDLEANVFSYPGGGYQEPHPDLPEKVVTHVLWFNEDWKADYGGCLRILNSRNEDDIAVELLPELGWSAVFVRSESSWHSVTAVTEDAPTDRRAVVVTFYLPGSVSTMWPEGP